MQADAGVWPTELRILLSARALEVDFESGETLAIPAELLRVESPSAEVQGHGSKGKTLVAGKSDVFIKDAQPVGHYAVRLIFSDGHDTGLFTWTYLHQVGRDQVRLWDDYLRALDHAGLSRKS